VKRCLGILLVLPTLTLAQAAPQKGLPNPKNQGTTAAARPAEGASATQTKAVSPETAVITLAGVCEKQPAKPEDCKTTVTRSQFETLLDALSGGRQNPQQITPQLKRQFALQYSRLLLFATSAEKQGLESKPETQQLIQFARLQALAQGLTRTLQEKARPSPAETQKYYDDNRSKFQELTLQRVMVPNKPAGEPKPDGSGDMKKLAAELRERAVKGTDFKALQAEAYQKAGMQNPPETRLVMQPETVPPTQRTVLQLKPGEVSQVIEDPGGFYIYKLESQQTTPLDKVRGQIETVLAQEKLQQEMESVAKGVTPDLNNDYFGQVPPAQGGISIQPVPQPSPGPGRK
jgi:parvulin-like peptidyl-prolyl isomerase